MKTAYFKDGVRKLKSSIFQYISIILIIALGVAFFVGMNVIAPNMNNTAEDYLEKSNIYDINLISTIGFDDNDLDTVRDHKDVKIAEGIYSQDVLSVSDETTLATRLFSIPDEDINRIDIVEGRMPEENNECVIDTRMQSMYDYEIGDTVKIKSGTEDDIYDLVNETEFKVVGIGRNPTFLSLYYGITPLETGELKSFLMVKKEVFETDYYSTIYIKTTKSDGYNYFADKDVYAEKMDNIGNSILNTLVDNAQKRYDDLYYELEDEIKDAEQELKDAEQELKDAKKEIEDAEKEIEEKEDLWKEVKRQYQVNSMLNPGSVTGLTLDMINQTLDKIEESKEELDEKKAEYEDKKNEYDSEYEENKEKLDDAKYELENFKVDLYYNNLTENESFVSLKNDLVKIGMMGKVFPLMFFIVAALVTITTVTRTIEEERGNIGILKALGYSNFTIAKRYIFYSILTALIGTALGMYLGNTIILQILYTSYSSLYVLPDMIGEIDWNITILVSAISLISIVGVTIFIVKKSLKEKASELMRPKSAKEGKNIFLENIGFLWSKFNFFYKSSFRNIFRYKRRLIMAVIGIAGCTALIYTGFALKNSIDTIAIRQFSQVKTYDMEVNLKNELSKEKIQDTLEYIKEIDDIENVAPVKQQSTSMWYGDKTKDLYYVVIDKKDVKNYIDLRDRKTGEVQKLNNKGIVITEKIAKTFGIKKGDKVKIGDEVNAKEVKVIGIAENYLYNYIYFTPEVYKTIFDEDVKYNQFFANTDGLDDDEYDDLIDELKDNDKISGVILTSMVNNEYQKSLNSLSSIVYLCIGCASILAFIVLVNLNIINIAERSRELATLKVLGFFEKEVSSYVFRENVILTIIGIISGMILGNFVLGIIIQSAEVDTIMLPNELSVKSLACAGALTLLFTIITNIVMTPKIRKINMIDSLKSVE